MHRICPCYLAPGLSKRDGPPNFVAAVAVAVAVVVVVVVVVV